MKKTIKNIIGVGVLLSSIVVLPIFAFAQTENGETSFGGLHLVTLDESVCDCGGNSYWVLDYKTNNVLMLYYQSGQSKLYSGYNLSGTYQLGTYSSGSQACSIEIYDDCYDLESQGTYGTLPGTGTTLTDASGAGINALFKTYEPAAKPKGSYFATLKGTAGGLFKEFSF